MNQRGTLTVEFAILVPAMVLLFGLVIGGARAWLARSAIEQVAGAGARAASLERTEAAGVRAATQLATAQATLSETRCQPLVLDIDAHTLSTPAGTPGQIRVTARCQVPLSDLLIPGWPGSVAVSASASAVVDTYRGRK